MFAGRPCSTKKSRSVGPFLRRRPWSSGRTDKTLRVDSDGHAQNHPPVRDPCRSDTGAPAVHSDAPGHTHACSGTHQCGGLHDHQHDHHGAPHQHDHHQHEHHNEDHDHEHGDDHHHHHHHDGNGHHCHHFEANPNWGPIRRGIRSAFSALGLLGAAEAWGSSLRASGASCAALLLSLVASQLAKTPPALDWALLCTACYKACLAVTFILSGVPACVEASFQVLSGNVDTHVLMFSAAVGTVVLAMPLEGAALLVLFHISHALEHYFAHTAQASLSVLVDTVPQRATVVGLSHAGAVDWASQAVVGVAAVAMGSLIAVKPGEMVPLDGTVVNGTALVGQESLTGESLPVPRAKGEDIAAGSLVYDGTLVIRTTRTAAESTPARIAKLTSEAARNRPRLELFLSGIASRWSAAVMAAVLATFAALVATGLPVLGATGAVYRCLGLLTAAAPCALVVTPLAYVCAMAVLTRHGVLVKGSHIIDVVRQVQCVALDKTGTVSKGRLQCVAIQRCSLAHGGAAAAPDADAEWAALGVAAAMSLRSRHPVCAAVLQHHHANREDARRATGRAPGGDAQDLPELAAFGVVPGYGMWAERLDGSGVLFGSVEYVSCALSPAQQGELQRHVQRSGGGRIVSVVLEGDGVVQAAASLASDAPAAGGDAGGGAAPERGGLRATVFVFADVAEADSAAAVAWIRQHGREVMVLTGDNLTSAAAMAIEVGIRPAELRGDLSPQDKKAFVQDVQGGGRAVMMVGDGINDGPALAAADVGVAVASSTDSATTAVAGVVVLRADAADGARPDSFRGAVGAVALLLHVAWATRRVVVQNLVIAFGSILLAALPAVRGLVPLWVTVLVHEGSTVLVALNCMRILAMRHPLRSPKPSSAVLAQL